MTEPGDNDYEDIYGVKQLESEIGDGDSAFREIVRILMDEDNPPDEERGPRSLSHHSFGHEGHWRSREYGQLIRDSIFCLSFIAVLLSVLIIIVLRSKTNQRQPPVSSQGESIFLSQFSDLLNDYASQFLSYKKCFSLKVCVSGVGGGGERQSNKATPGDSKSEASQKSTKSKFRASLKSTVVRVGGETRLGEESSRDCGDISIV